MNQVHRAIGKSLIKGMVEFWSNLLNNETLDENLIGEINDHLRKDENYNFQTSPDFQKSPSYLLTPMHHSGESFGSFHGFPPPTKSSKRILIE